MDIKEDIIKKINKRVEKEKENFSKEENECINIIENSMKQPIQELRNFYKMINFVCDTDKEKVKLLSSIINTVLITENNSDVDRTINNINLLNEELIKQIKEYDKIINK